MLIYLGVCKEVLASDWFILVNLALFSFTCGHFTSIGMKYGSDESTGDRGLGGTITGIWLSAGIFAGSTTALIIFK